MSATLGRIAVSGNIFTLLPHPHPRQSNFASPPAFPPHRSGPRNSHRDSHVASRIPPAPFAAMADFARTIRPPTIRQGAAGCRTHGSGAEPTEQATHGFRRCGFQPRRGMRDYRKHWPFRLFSPSQTPRGRDARAPTAHPLSSRISESAKRFSCFSMLIPPPSSPFESAKRHSRHSCRFPPRPPQPSPGTRAARP